METWYVPFFTISINFNTTNLLTLNLSALLLLPLPLLINYVRKTMSMRPNASSLSSSARFVSHTFPLYMYDTIIFPRYRPCHILRIRRSGPRCRCPWHMPRIFRVRQPRHVHCYTSIQGSLLSIFSHLVAVQPGCQGRLPFRARVPHAPTRCCRHFTTAAAIRQRTLLVFVASLSLDLLADAEGPPLAAPLASKTLTSKRKRASSVVLYTAWRGCLHGLAGRYSGAMPAAGCQRSAVVNAQQLTRSWVSHCCRHLTYIIPTHLDVRRSWPEVGVLRSGEAAGNTANDRMALEEH